MTKAMWIGAALAVFMLAGVAGMTTLLAKSKHIVSVHVIEDTSGYSTSTYSGSGSVAEVIQQAVDDGAIGRGEADEILRSAAGQGEADGVVRLEIGEGDDAAEAIRQAVEGGSLSQAVADIIAQAVEAKGVQPEVVTVIPGAADVVSRDIVSGAEADEILNSAAAKGAKVMYFDAGAEGGVPEALRAAVEAGEISQDLADEILALLGNAGS